MDVWKPPSEPTGLVVAWITARGGGDCADEARRHGDTRSGRRGGRRAG